MRIPVAPFLLPGPSSVSHLGWTVEMFEASVPLPAHLTGWDYQGEIRLTGGVRVAVSNVLSEAGLGDETELQLVVRSHSSNTKIERTLFRSTVPHSDAYEASIDLVVESNALGGRLNLDTLLVATVPFPTDPLAASHAASILWRVRHSTDLEGSGGQFPTDAEDFALTRPEVANAGWVLHVDFSDVEVQFTSAVRLTMNSGSPAVQALLRGGQDGATKLLAKTLDIDVTRQLVNYALSIEEIALSNLDHDSTTLAGVLRSLLAQLWPTTSIATLQRLARDRPDRLESHIQSVRRLGS